MKKIAAIKPFKLKDSITGNLIRLSVSKRYSVLSINNRSYYFFRETGKLDGTSTDFNVSCEGG